jgi:hypothetical protein
MPSYVRGAKARRLTNAEIIRLYVDELLDSDSIGFRAGCSGTTILNIVRAAGHPVRQAGRGAPRHRNISDEEIIARYRSGISGPAIADAAGCSASAIYHVLRRAGVQVRDSATAGSLAERLRAERKDAPGG